MPYPAKPPTQSVGTVVHRPHSINDLFAGHPTAFSGNHCGDGAPGRDAHLTFYFHFSLFLPMENRKTKAPISTQTNCLRQNERLCPFASIIHPFLHIVKRKTYDFAKKLKICRQAQKNCKKGLTNLSRRCIIHSVRGKDVLEQAA